MTAATLLTQVNTNTLQELVGHGSIAVTTAVTLLIQVNTNISQTLTGPGSPATETACLTCPGNKHFTETGMTW